jgi:hypothetical protein
MVFLPLAKKGIATEAQKHREIHVHVVLMLQDIKLINGFLCFRALCGNNFHRR